jgi:hypothetical protein
MDIPELITTDPILSKEERTKEMQRLHLELEFQRSVPKVAHGIVFYNKNGANNLTYFN